MEAEPTTAAPQPAAQPPKAEQPKPAEKKPEEVSMQRLNVAILVVFCYCKMMANFLHFELIPCWYVDMEKETNFHMLKQ